MCKITHTEAYLMADMPGPNETRLNLIDGVEYITLRADDFRTAMRERDALNDALRTENEQLKQDNAELSAECDQWGEKVAACWREIEWLRKIERAARAAVETEKTLGYVSLTLLADVLDESSQS